MKAILYIKGSYIGDVRLRKFINYFVSQNCDIAFWGWDRKKTNLQLSGVNLSYIFKGGGSANRKLLLYYPVWMCVLFFKLLLCRNIKNNNLIAINFDAAFPVYLVSKLRKLNYIYEIYDEFAISYNFPHWLKRFFIFLDHKIIDNASSIIHVDVNRINYKGKDGKKEIIVIENTPYDFFDGDDRNYDIVKRSFAVSGLMNSIRGLEQIMLFAKQNPQIKILCIGGINEMLLKKEISLIKNIECYDFMPQEDAFKLMLSCCAIFSLYNPTLEINRLAASNKVYDAMMLGIPVITNKEVINSSFINKNNIGYVINYSFDDSWKILSDVDFVNTSRIKGLNGRNLYLERFCFDKIVEEKLLPILS